MEAISYHHNRQDINTDQNKNLVGNKTVADGEFGRSSLETNPGGSGMALPENARLYPTPWPMGFGDCIACWPADVVFLLRFGLDTKAVKFLWKGSDLSWCSSAKGSWRPGATLWHRAMESAGLWADTCKPSGGHAREAAVNSAAAFIESMNDVRCLVWMMMSDAIVTFELAYKNLFIKCLVPLLAKSVTTLKCKRTTLKNHTDPFSSFLSILKSIFFHCCSSYFL